MSNKTNSIEYWIKPIEEKPKEMTRTQKIEALADDHDAECWRIAPYKEVSNGDSFKAGILAGIALRDAELLAMEFDEKECDRLSQGYGTDRTSSRIKRDTFKTGARWQHEQMLKAIKGDG